MAIILLVLARYKLGMKLGTTINAYPKHDMGSRQSPVYHSHIKLINSLVIRQASPPALMIRSVRFCPILSDREWRLGQRYACGAHAVASRRFGCGPTRLQLLTWLGLPTDTYEKVLAWSPQSCQSVSDSWVTSSLKPRGAGISSQLPLAGGGEYIAPPPV